MEVSLLLLPIVLYWRTDKVCKEKTRGSNLPLVGPTPHNEPHKKVQYNIDKSVPEITSKVSELGRDFTYSPWTQLAYITPIIGNGGGRQEGGGIRIFPAGGEALFAPGGGVVL